MTTGSGTRRGAVATALAVVASALLLLVGLGAATLTAAPAGAQSVEASLDDDDLGWGETTTLRDSGWAPGQPVIVALYPNAIELARPVAADDGTLTAVIQIPSGLGSSPNYHLGLQGIRPGGGPAAAQVPLTIRGPIPDVAVPDPEVGWNELVTVVGQRWEPGTSVDLTLMPVTQLLASVPVGPDGTFSAQVQIPEVPSSTEYAVVATGQGIDKLFHYRAAQITILGTPASFTVSESTLAWGQTTRVVGDLFQPGSLAKVHLFPDNIFLAETTVGADRRFELDVQIPSGIASSTEYLLVVTGAQANGQLAFLGHQITVIGERPFMEVTDVSSGGTKTLQITGHRFKRGTTAVVTMLPGSERLGEAVVGPDDTFTIRVTVPPDVAGPDPHVVAVTGQGTDGLFAFLGHRIVLGTGDAITVGGAVPPRGLAGDDGDDGPRVARPLRSPLESVMEDLRLEAVQPDDESADELFLALLLLVLMVVGGWFLHHALRSDLGPALERQRVRLRSILPRRP